MVRIGNVFLEGTAVEAIVPEYLTQRTAGKAVTQGWDIHLAGGTVISLNVSEEELRPLLEEAGYQTSEPEQTENPQFTPGELEEMATAFRAGFLFVARDGDGKVFAYKGRPKKGKISWQHDVAKRLYQDYTAVSFDDPEPLDLTALFTAGVAE